MLGYVTVHQSRGDFFHFKGTSVFGAVTVVLNLCYFVCVVRHPVNSFFLPSLLCSLRGEADREKLLGSFLDVLLQRRRKEEWRAVFSGAGAEAFVAAWLDSEA